MRRGSRTERLARASSRRPARVIAIWVVAVVASFAAIGMFLGDVLTTDVEITSETESKRANDLLSGADQELRQRTVDRGAGVEVRADLVEAQPVALDVAERQALHSRCRVERGYQDAQGVVERLRGPVARLEELRGGRIACGTAERASSFTESPRNRLLDRPGGFRFTCAGHHVTSQDDARISPGSVLRSER
jgi:hypothetical protein